MSDQICYAVLCVFSYIAAGLEQRKRQQQQHQQQSQQQPQQHQEEGGQRFKQQYTPQTRFQTPQKR
jgi:hypothetical protein